LKLVKVCNPWGTKRSEWTGAFNNQDPAWDEHFKTLKERLTFSEGTFWMRFEDWITNFNKVYACRTFDSGWTSFKLDGIFA